MALINSPPINAVDDESGVAAPWRNFFVSVFNICAALTTSGTTAQRPTSLIWIGRTYFDTTLGIPIWVQSVGPLVWCDATGAAV